MPLITLLEEALHLNLKRKLGKIFFWESESESERVRERECVCERERVQPEPILLSAIMAEVLVRLT